MLFSVAQANVPSLYRSKAYIFQCKRLLDGLE